jgi:hypothetical protein
MEEDILEVKPVRLEAVVTDMDRLKGNLLRQYELLKGGRETEGQGIAYQAFQQYLLGARSQYIRKIRLLDTVMKYME